MKSPLICLISPLSRPVSKRTVRRKQLVMSGTKEGPHKLHTQPKESLVSSPTSDHDVSDLSSRKSSGMEAGASLASVVSSKNKQDSANNQNDDDDPQEIDEIYHTSTVIKKKKSSPVKGISVASPRIQKQRKSMPFVSPGKRSLSGNRHGLDRIHRRRTVSMTIVDMKKLSEAIESRIGEQKKCEKVDNDTQPFEPDASFTTSVCDVSGLLSNKSPVIERNELLTDSSKNQEQHCHLKGTGEINLQPAVPKRKTSSASKTVASRSPRVQKGRRSMTLVSPGQRSLSRSMHGLDGIHRRRAVSMTTMDMKKLCEAIESRVRKKKRTKNVDLDTQPHELEVSFTTRDHDVSGHLTNSSQSQESVDFLQRIDEMYLKNEVKKRKHPCKTTSVASRSSRLQKRSSMPFVSPGKRSKSRSTNGLDKIHRRRTVSMTTIDMKKLQEFIDCSQVRKKENEKIDDDTQPPNTSLTVNDADISGSSSSPGVEADVFLAGMVDNTKDSTQNLEPDDDHRRSDDSSHKCEVTKRKTISSCKNISTATRSPRIQKQRSSVPFVSPGQRLLSRSMRGLDEIHRCRSLKKLDKKKLQQAIDLSHIRMKKTGEKVGQNPLHTIKSPSKEIKELVKTAVDKKKQSDNLNCLNGRQSLLKPELSTQDNAVAPRPKENEEDITHVSGFAVQENNGKTPDLNFKKLDEMYESRFNPSQKCPQAVVTSRGQECTQADLDFEKLDEMYERWFNPSPECTDEAVVDMDTVTRILSFQDEQTDSRSSSPPIIQRRAFAGDIIDPDESDDISDSTVDEANKTLLEKEISSFFESKKGHSPKDFKTGAPTLGVAPSCVQQETENGVSEDDPVTGTGATLQSQNVPEHDDIMVIDGTTHYRTPDSLQEMEDQATSPKCAPLAGRDHAMASLRYNFGESMPIGVEMDGQQDDICTPFQHSTPADPTHHPQSHAKTTSQDLLSAWAEIQREKKLFVMYCHEDSAPCILKDLESCQAIIDGRSLSLRYLNDTSSVEVQGMVLKDEHVTRPKKIPKENGKDAAKKEKKKKGKKVLTVSGADGNKNDAPKRKKKSGTIKEMKKQKDTKMETKEARKEGTKTGAKKKTKPEMNTEGKIKTEKELKKAMKKRTKREAKKQTKREKQKEPKGETEKETKKPTKKKTHTDKKNVPESEIENDMRKEATKEAKKPTKKKRKTDREEPKSEQETETKKPTKKKRKAIWKEPKIEQETETIEPTKKKTKTEKKKELKKEMKNKAGEQTKTGAEKETQKKTKVDKKKEPKIKMQKTTKNKAMKETEKEAVNEIKKEKKKRLRKETTKNKRIRVKTDVPKEVTEEVIKKKKEETIQDKKKATKKEVRKETKEKRKKETKKGTTEGTTKETKKKAKKDAKKDTKNEISKGRKEGTQKETKKKTKKDTVKGTKEGKKKKSKNEAKNEERKVTNPDGSMR